MSILKSDIVLIVGLPASGKTSIVNEYKAAGYTVVSCDDNTMLTATDTASLDIIADRGEKIVIDNTNTIQATRQAFRTWALRSGFTIGLHHVKTSKDDCLINSLHRMHDRHGEVWMAQDITPKLTKSYPNDFVLSAIFAMNKNFEKIDKTEKAKYDEYLESKFVREDKYGYTNKAVFIDLDGTVRKSNGPEPYPVEQSDIEILPNSEKVLNEYANKGYMIIGVTNQSGVTKGTVTADRVAELIVETDKQLGIIMDDAHFCPHLPPKSMCYCRKPQSGVGVKMMHKHQLNLSECIMVGDRTEDKTFATRLGMTYHHADDFFNRKD